MKFFKSLIALLLLLSSAAFADTPSQGQINAVLEKLKKEEMIEAAQQNSTSTVLTCPPGMPRGKTEDLAEFIAKHQLVQDRISKELAEFKSGKTTKNKAIDQFNNSVKATNLVIRWGKGRATDVCFSKTLLNESGKTTGATRIILEAFRNELMKR